MKTLVLGGIRSGKSRIAESLAIEYAEPISYIATATAENEEVNNP